VIEWYPWIVLLHVIGAFGFVFAHGASAFAAFRIRTDPRPESVASMLALSGGALTVMYPSLLLLLVGGIWAAFAGDLWGHWWVWAALGLLIGVAAAMYAVGTRYYVALRQRLAVEGGVPEGDPDFAAVLDSRRPEMLAAIGGTGLLLILWLMVVKPG
jgi:hypothetical protein